MNIFYEFLVCELEDARDENNSSSVLVRYFQCWDLDLFW